MASGLVTSVVRSPVGSFVEAVLRGVGQVMLQDNPLTGAIFLVGIFLSSTTAGLYALLGTAVATATAMLAGVDRAAVRHGLYGFNGTLTGIALSAYATHGYARFGYVVFACVAVTAFTAAVHNFVNSAHIPTLTAAFVATTWVFLAGLRQFGRLRPGARPCPRRGCRPNRCPGRRT